MYISSFFFTKIDILILAVLAYLLYPVTNKFETMKFEKFYSDDEYLLSSRKTRKDVLTPWHAVDARKSSKNHKLKPRLPSRDKTKTEESKTKTRDRQQSRLSSVY